MDDHDLLIRVDAKMDTLVQRLEEHIIQSGETHSDFRSRVNALEQWKWKWAGAISLGVFLVTISLNLVLRLIP